MSTIPTFNIDSRALQMMQQRERFNWFARSLEDRMQTYSLNQLLDLLHDSRPSWPAQREKVLVLLALKGTVEAAEVIAEYDPGCDENAQVFHAVCADEWARRLTGFAA